MPGIERDSQHEGCCGVGVSNKPSTYPPSAHPSAPKLKIIKTLYFFPFLRGSPCRGLSCALRQTAKREEEQQPHP